jgi:hypothetical protein
MLGWLPAAAAERIYTAGKPLSIPFEDELSARGQRPISGSMLEDIADAADCMDELAREW